MLHMFKNYIIGYVLHNLKTSLKVSVVTIVGHANVEKKSIILLIPEIPIRSIIYVLKYKV